MYTKLEIIGIISFIIIGILTTAGTIAIKYEKLKDEIVTMEKNEWHLMN